MKTNTAKNLPLRVLKQIILILFALIVLYPIFFVFMTSFKSNFDVISHPFGMSTFQMCIRDRIWTEAVADFEAETGAKINVISMSWDKLSNSLQTYFAAGDAPDVMATFGTGTYKAMGVIEDLTPYLTENDNEWLDQFSRCV